MSKVGLLIRVSRVRVPDGSPAVLRFRYCEPARVPLDGKMTAKAPGNVRPRARAIGPGLLVLPGRSHAGSPSFRVVFIGSIASCGDAPFPFTGVPSFTGVPGLFSFLPVSAQG